LAGANISNRFTGERGLGWLAALWRL
jgi:hypothetical protein